MNRDLKEGTVKAKMKPRGRAFQAEEQHMQGPEQEYVWYVGGAANRPEWPEQTSKRKRVRGSDREEISRSLLETHVQMLSEQLDIWDR